MMEQDTGKKRKDPVGGMSSDRVQFALCGEEENQEDHKTGETDIL